LDTQPYVQPVAEMSVARHLIYLSEVIEWAIGANMMFMFRPK